MKEAQAEIKAIQAKLRSIRAHERDGQPRHSPHHWSESAYPRNFDTPEVAASHPFTPFVSSQSQSYSQLHSPPSAAGTSYGHSPQHPSMHSPYSYNDRPSSYSASGHPSHDDSHPDYATDRPERSTLRSGPHMPSFPEFLPETPEQSLNQSLLQLETQADYINQLAEAQEAAILKLRAIAETAEQTWKVVQQTPRSPFDPPNPAAEEIEIPALCEYLDAVVPCVEKDEEGVLLLTTRTVDLYRAEREASWMAQTLRYRNGQKPHVAAPTRAVKRKKYRSSRSKKSAFSMGEVVGLVVGAILLRVALNFVLVSFPGLWTPMLAMLMTPVAIAVFRTPLTTQSGFTWASRLFAVLLGLLIGGRI